MGELTADEVVKNFGHAPHLEGGKNFRIEPTVADCRTTLARIEKEGVSDGSGGLFAVPSCLGTNDIGLAWPVLVGEKADGSPFVQRLVGETISCFRDTQIYPISLFHERLEWIEGDDYDWGHPGEFRVSSEAMRLLRIAAGMPAEGAPGHRNHAIRDATPIVPPADGVAHTDSTATQKEPDQSSPTMNPIDACIVRCYQFRDTENEERIAKGQKPLNPPSQRKIAEFIRTAAASP